VGNTRGAVLTSNKIFAGLETPTAYNTVGGATGEEDKWNLTTTIDPVTVEATAWVQMTEAEANQAKRVEEATGATYPHLHAFKKEGVELVAGQKVEVTLTYKEGSNKLYIGGIDLLASNGDIAAMDYHVGYTGSSHDKNTYTFIVPNTGTYAIRAIVHNKSEAINAKSELTANIYTPKEGVVINTDIVGIQGRWSRNTTLAAGETWKVASVVGLIAQDGTQANADIHSTQKRRSFLAYSERERAVPWRAMPMYLTWYELQINRNNANPGREHLDNTKVDDVLDVLSHWKTYFYDRYGVSPEIFIIDDGWDKYGEWTFHESFPNEMRDMSKLAKEMLSINLLATLMVYAVLAVVLCMDVFSGYNTLLFISSFSIILTTLAVEWVYQAMEEYVYISLRTIGFQILAIIMLFVFVRDENDMVWYAIITVIASYGYGIFNILTRLRLKYGEEVGFAYEVEEDGTRCIIWIPYVEE
jgi:hypothetical protein